MRVWMQAHACFDVFIYVLICECLIYGVSTIGILPEVWPFFMARLNFEKKTLFFLLICQSENQFQYLFIFTQSNTLHHLDKKYVTITLDFR